MRWHCICVDLEYLAFWNKRLFFCLLSVSPNKNTISSNHHPWSPLHAFIYFGAPSVVKPGNVNRSKEASQRRANERKEQYKQVRAHVKKEDGRVQVKLNPVKKMCIYLNVSQAFFHRFCGNKHNRFSEILSLGDKSLSLGKLMSLEEIFLVFILKNCIFLTKIFQNFPDFWVYMWRCEV